MIRNRSTEQAQIDPSTLSRETAHRHELHCWQLVHALVCAYPIIAMQTAIATLFEHLVSRFLIDTVACSHRRAEYCSVMARIIALSYGYTHSLARLLNTTS